MDGIDHKMTKKTWEEIGTVIGSTSVDGYGFCYQVSKRVSVI